MLNTELLKIAKQFLDGKDFFIDAFYSKKTMKNYKVVCYTLDDKPEHIKASELEQLVAVRNENR